MEDSFATNLRRLIRARFPLLSIQTAEESRALSEIAAVVGNRTQVVPASAGLHLVHRKWFRRARPARQSRTPGPRTRRWPRPPR